MRYLPAILFLATGGVVGWYNASQTGSVVVLPFLASLLPSIAHDADAQGFATATLFVVAGLLLGGGRVWLDLRARRRGDAPTPL
jgi:hypothetical protein